MYRREFFSQLSGQTFYNNEYGHLSEEGFCDFFASPDASCLASTNVWSLPKDAVLDETGIGIDFWKKYSAVKVHKIPQMEQKTSFMIRLRWESFGLLP